MLSVVWFLLPHAYTGVRQAELQGMPVNKQQLKIPIGFLKDTLSCAHYNFVNGTAMELSVRQRGGRR